MTDPFYEIEELRTQIKEIESKILQAKNNRKNDSTRLAFMKARKLKLQTDLLNDKYYLPF